jgi:hypothetical protein
MTTVGDLLEWSRRTLFYLQFFRDDDEWKAMPEDVRNKLAHQAAEGATLQLWSEAETECANAPGLLAIVFPRLVLKAVAQKVPH